jgi:formate dehydrogenase alpha subunit
MKLTIDGKKIETEGKKTILEVARENDIYIPALCDHPILDPFTGCRLCIVEVEGRRGFAPSCSTFIEEGMEVKSDSPSLRKMRKDILGLILSEHPDACLICTEKKNCDEYKSTIRKVGEVTGCVLCPNNGRCDLQDVVEAVGIDKVDFPSVYRDFPIKKNDPFFDRNYNLCILCGRCVRVCHELRGSSTVHFINRGSEAKIGTALDLPLQESGCQFCGACVDVCPTGALTERAIKYEPLPDVTAKTLCPFCGIGCELEVMLKKDRILYAKPSERGVVNRGQACVKGRFLIKDAVYSPQRIKRPMIRRNKELEEVSWEEALDFAAKKIKAFKGSEIGLITCPQLSCEDQFMAEKFAEEALKTKNVAPATGFTPVDSLSQLAQKNEIAPIFNFKIEDIAQADVIFLAGTDLAISHPILWLEVLKAVRGGAKLMVASPFEIVGHRYVSLWFPVEPGNEDLLFQYLAKMIQKKGKAQGHGFKGYESFRKFLDKLKLSDFKERTGIDENDLSLAAELLMVGKSCFIAGNGVTPNPGENQNMAAIWNLAILCGGQLISLGLENNSRGVFAINRKKSPKGKLSSQIVQDAREGQIKALYLIGSSPVDTKKKVKFLIVQDSYMNGIARRADAIFPATTFAETEGTFVNVEGRIQKFCKVIPPFGEAKPDWWIFVQLAKRLGKKDFDYKSSQQVLKDLKKTVPAFAKIRPADLEKGKTQFVSEEEKGEPGFLSLRSRDQSAKSNKKFPFSLWANYSLDSYRNLILSKEIKGLEVVRNCMWIKLNPQDAAALKLKEGESIVVESPEGKIEGLGKITEAVPKGMVEASLLWNEDREYSMAYLVTSFRENSRLPLPVKIKRGK